MKWLGILLDRMRGLVRRDQVINDIEEELRSHMQMEIEANQELGMTPDEARRAASKSFGNTSSVKDLAYEVRGGGFLETLWQDLRYSM